jgi:hypothetical protein
MLTRICLDRDTKWLTDTFPDLACNRLASTPSRTAAERDLRGVDNWQTFVQPWYRAIECKSISTGSAKYNRRLGLTEQASSSHRYIRCCTHMVRLCLVLQRQTPSSNRTAVCLLSAGFRFWTGLDMQSFISSIFHNTSDRSTWMLDLMSWKHLALQQGYGPMANAGLVLDQAGRWRAVCSL